MYFDSEVREILKAPDWDHFLQTWAGLYEVPFLCWRLICQVQTGLLKPNFDWKEVRKRKKVTIPCASNLPFSLRLRSLPVLGESNSLCKLRCHANSDCRHSKCSNIVFIKHVTSMIQGSDRNGLNRYHCWIIINNLQTLSGKVGKNRENVAGRFANILVTVYLLIWSKLFIDRSFFPLVSIDDSKMKRTI